MDEFVGEHGAAPSALDAGRGVVLDGVAHEERGHAVLLNPAYTLLAR